MKRTKAQALAEYVSTAREYLDRIEEVVTMETDTRAATGRARRAYLQVKVDEARAALSAIALVFKEE